MHLIDGDGRRYLDGVSSLWANVHGHRVPEIDAAIRAQLDKVAHTTMLGLASEPAILLADRLMRLVPPGLKKIFYSDAGATATEISFKLAAQYWYNVGRPEKCEFVGFTEAYHGDTISAMSIGRTTAFHRPYFRCCSRSISRDDAVRVPVPADVRLQQRDVRPRRLPARLGREDAVPRVPRAHPRAAPRAARGGVHRADRAGGGGDDHAPARLPPWRARLCTKFDVLLIADEVAVGFGRTGRMFACEHEGVEPDLMCVAKGLTGGYLPLAATFATQQIFDAFLGDPWEGRVLPRPHLHRQSARLRRRPRVARSVRQTRSAGEGPREGRMARPGAL